MSKTAKIAERVRVNKAQLVKALMSIVGPTPATFTAVTEVAMNKTLDGDRSKPNPYHGRVTKEQISNVFINFNYQNSVNKALAKEGKEADFEAHPRKWGERVPGTPLILHKGEYYLEARFLANEPKVRYMLDGQDIDKSEIEAYLPKKNTESLKESQGLEEPIIIRDFKISGMREIKFDGKVLEVTE